MLRKFAGAFLVVFSLALSGTAWAITATVTGQETGQATKGGDLTLVVHSHGVARTYRGKIDPTTGKATVPAVVRKGDIVYASLDGGVTGKRVTEKELNGEINFSSGVGPIPPPPTYTGSPTTYTPSPQGVWRGPMPQNNWSGFYIGGQGSYGSFDQRITERVASTDMVSDILLNTKGMAGVGLVGGYDFSGLGIPGLTIGPTASINYFGQSNNQVFSNETFLGTRTNWIADIGGRVGYWGEDRSRSIYGVAGLELLNYDLQSNFLGPVIAVNRTATGFFAGGGVEYTRPDWRMGDGQWTTFGQLTFSWFCGDSVRMPEFSPSFDFSTRISQVRASVGFLYRPGAPPPPP